MAVANKLVNKPVQKVETTKYMANGMQVTLTPGTVKNYLISGDKDRVSDQEVAMFINLCRFTGLNPWLREAYCIQNFKPTPYYEINAEFNSGFTGTMLGDAFKNKTEAEKVVENLKGKSGVVKEFKCEDKQTAAPTLFSIDALQVEMGKKFKFAPDKTLEIAQALYEKYKVTTYPRTDSNVIPDDVWNEIDRHIASVLCVSEVAAVKNEIKVPAKPEKRYVNNGKVTDHHAIIPTITAKKNKQRWERKGFILSFNFSFFHLSSSISPLPLVLPLPSFQRVAPWRIYGIAFLIN